MPKSILIIIFFFICNLISAQITLTHNVGNTPIKTNIATCQYEEAWARAFTLADYGISTTDQFIITSGQVAISNSYAGARLVFNIYALSSEAPDNNPQRISYGNLVLAPEIGDIPEIVQINFATPITIPAGIERILVEVTQVDDIYNDDYKKVLIAGTEFDNDKSWFIGCREYYTHIATENLSPPVPDANFYINVTGKVKNIASSGSSVTVTNNVCDDIIETSIHSCSSSYIYWARDFYLEEFGISTEEEFVITSGQVGINKVGWLPEISFNIYAIDDNFPGSFSETSLIGSSQYHTLSPNIDQNSQIINVSFETPVVVPAGVQRILVEVHKGIVYGDGLAFIAGSSQDTGVSWQRGCTRTSSEHDFGFNEYVSTVDFGRPDAKFYINVTGDVNHVTNNFSMNISNICSEFLKEFSIAPLSNIASIVWNFDDSPSGSNNISNDVSPFHDFTIDGTYTITATVTATNGSVEVLTETIDVKEPPNAYGIENYYGCEDNFGTGISSSFDLSQVTQQVLGGQNNMKVTFIDESGNKYENLPNVFTNTVKDRETITVRVAHSNNLCCYSEITFDLIVNPIPDLTSVVDLFECSNETNGFSTFDLEQVENKILADNNDTTVSFYRSNGSLINLALNSVPNEIPNEETISVRVINNINNCYNETTFRLMINTLPVANELEVLYGCDDDGDGISQYFDTSYVESQVLGNQIGLTVSYYDGNDNLLPSPLPNPYTNTNTIEETITVRVTNKITLCSNETSLILRTSSQPQLNSPEPIYACDLGNGFARFDISHVEEEITGSQSGLAVHFLDAEGEELTSSDFYENTAAWNQTIYVKVENELNGSCYAETNLNLIVNELPITELLDSSYIICGLEPSLFLQIESDFEYYQWSYEDGTIISNTFEAEIINTGKYSLIIGHTTNGVYCENLFDFELKRSALPEIIEIKQRELSDANFIEIIATGDGAFEYSIDGIRFQESNYFPNLQGGYYTAIVKDIKGCGEDSQQIVLLDYPKFFTPNNDGINDFWQIYGIREFPDSIILIFDRYGKLITQLSSNDIGWNGLFNEKQLMMNDYWFRVDLGNGQNFSGHFTLKR